MSTHSRQDRDALIQGTLDLLVLRILVLGSHHGQGIARAIQQRSGDSLLVDHGSLYPALQRLEAAGWVRAEWGVSDNNRRATVELPRQFSIESGGGAQRAFAARHEHHLTPLRSAKHAPAPL